MRGGPQSPGQGKDDSLGPAPAGAVVMSHDYVDSLGAHSPRVQSVPGDAIRDFRTQRGGLIFPGFISATGFATASGRTRRAQLPRYLRAMLIRLQALPREAVRDAAWQATVESLTEEYRQLVDSRPSTGALDADLESIRWMLEELRVSLFAQTLGTDGPVSEQRIVKAMDRISA